MKASKPICSRNSKPYPVLTPALIMLILAVSSGFSWLAEQARNRRSLACRVCSQLRASKLGVASLGYHQLLFTVLYLAQAATDSEIGFWELAGICLAVAMVAVVSIVMIQVGIAKRRHEELSEVELEGVRNWLKKKLAEMAKEPVTKSQEP